jgi:O-antigen/teichoic acid export membrane protein
MDAPDDGSRANRRASQERVSRSAGFAFLAQMVGAALTGILVIFLGRRLPPTQYGAFTFALSVITLATLFADLGITSSAGRFLAERRHDEEAAGAVFRTALRLKLRVALPATLLLFALAAPICDVFGASAAVWPLRGFAIALLAQSMFLLLLGAFIALGKLRYNFVLATVESIVETVLSIVLVLLGAAATGAAFGRAIGYIVGFGVGLLVAYRTIGDLRGGAHDHTVVPPRRILSYAGPLLLVDAAFRVFASIDVLLIQAIVGGSLEQVATFGLPMRLAVFLDYPAAAVANAVSPRLARASGEGATDVRLLTQSVRYLTIMQMLFTVPLLIWPEAIMNLLFPGKYPGAAAVLRALSPYVYLAGIAQLTTLSVNYLGFARRRVPFAIGMLTINVVVDVVLLPKIGIVAAAIGTSAAYALWVPAHVWLLHRHAGLALRPLAITNVRSCLAGAAMAGALALLGTGRVALPLMLAGVVVGPLVHLAALFVLRELTADDIAVARRIISRRVPA